MVDLRILATTDLHMEVTGFDYVRGCAAAASGLPGLARIIAAERADAANCLFFDNGDLLQGNPLADLLASPDRRRPRGPHPAVASLGALGCDAATLGNHDLGYGTGFLAHSLKGAAYPVVCANLRMPGRVQLSPWTVLHRDLVSRDGSRQSLRIGVIGFLPPQTAAWEAIAAPGLRTEDILTAARREVPRLRAAGAQVVVALAHSGLGAGDENAATALAALPGIDVVIAGHTHDTFPGPGAVAGVGVDAAAGTLWGKPAVQPGFGGSHLGVIDLVLQRTGSGERVGWHVGGHHARLETATSPASTPALAPDLREAHRHAVRRFSRRAGRTEAALTSHFALIGHDPGLRLVAQAQRWHLRRLLGGAAAGRPILAAVAPFRCGGRGGPQHYTDIPPGRLSRRSLTDLYAFDNRLVILDLSGAELRDWLERAAGIFNRLREGVADQPLIDPAFPAYNFDVIDGLDWTLDLAAPRQFDSNGATGATAGRVRDVMHRGRPVRPDDRFLLATNSYRLSGAGLYGPLLRDRQPLLKTPERVRDILHAYLRRIRRAAPAGRLGFRFAPLPGASLLFDTGPGAAAHLPQAPLPAEPLGLTEAGFLRLRLRLD